MTPLREKFADLARKKWGSKLSEILGGEIEQVTFSSLKELDFLRKSNLDIPVSKYFDVPKTQAIEVINWISQVINTNMQAASLVLPFSDDIGYVKTRFCDLARPLGDLLKYELIIVCNPSNSFGFLVDVGEEIDFDFWGEWDIEQCKPLMRFAN
jgi:hypothetical protein